MTRFGWMTLAAGVLLISAGCAQPIPERAIEAVPKVPDAISFFGDALFSDEPSAELVDKLGAARAEWQASPEDVVKLIWYGRRAAYAGRHGEAIDIYSQGIEQHPDDARLYRHRGHRYISTRQLDRAIADFEKAAALVDGQQDQVEPDGMPNALGIPVSTLHSNIWYHLGLAHYLKGEYEQALEAYQHRLASEPNNDMLVSTAHWRYMTLRRLGREDEAEAMLEGITADMKIIENTAYHQLCLFYKGELDEAGLLGSGEVGSANAAIAYGLGSWYLGNGDRERAEEIFEGILSKGQWAAFGHIAAEADLARMREEGVS